MSCCSAYRNLIIVCTSGLCLKGIDELNEVWATVLATRRKSRWKGEVASKNVALIFFNLFTNDLDLVSCLDTSLTKYADAASYYK